MYTFLEIQNLLNDIPLISDDSSDIIIPPLSMYGCIDTENNAFAEISFFRAIFPEMILDTNENCPTPSLSDLSTSPAKVKRSAKSPTKTLIKVSFEICNDVVNMI